MQQPHPELQAAYDDEEMFPHLPAPCEEFRPFPEAAATAACTALWGAGASTPTLVRVTGLHLARLVGGQVPRPPEGALPPQVLTAAEGFAGWVASRVGLRGSDGSRQLSAHVKVQTTRYAALDREASWSAVGWRLARQWADELGLGCARAERWVVEALIRSAVPGSVHPRPEADELPRSQLLAHIGRQMTAHPDRVPGWLDRMYVPSKAAGTSDPLAVPATSAHVIWLGQRAFRRRAADPYSWPVDPLLAYRRERFEATRGVTTLTARRWVEWGLLAQHATIAGVLDGFPPDRAVLKLLADADPLPPASKRRKARPVPLPPRPPKEANPYYRRTGPSRFPGQPDLDVEIVL